MTSSSVDGDDKLKEVTSRSVEERSSIPSSSSMRNFGSTAESQISHREKEKMRREVIHGWICRLESMLPSESEGFTHAQLKKQSKSRVLERTVQFIHLLQKSNQQQEEHLNQLTMKCTALQMTNVDQIRQELQKVQDENRELKQLLSPSNNQSTSDNSNSS